MNNRSPPLASTSGMWGHAHPRIQLPDAQQPQGPVRNLVSYFNSMAHTSPPASVSMDADTGAPPRFVATERVGWVTELGLPAEQIRRFEWSDVAPQDPELAERLSDVGQVVQQLQGLGSDLVRATGEIRTQLEHCHGQTQTVGGIVNECFKALDDHTTNLRQAATARFAVAVRSTCSISPRRPSRAVSRLFSSGFQCRGSLLKFTDCLHKTILVSLQCGHNLGDRRLQG